ncbi:MAG: STAS domain-containing protein [Burkholderiaceae bacterium]
MPTTEIQRELARQTAEKIDRIESEMIAASLPIPSAPKRVQQRIEAARAGADAIDPMTLPPLEMPTDIVGSVADEEFRIVEGPLAPEFEEAAILFANGQGEAAAATLAMVLVDGNELARSQQGWMMLLDVYQSLGSQDAFEAAAIAYAARFEVSPPAWRGDHADAGQAPEQAAPPARGGLGVAVAARLDESFGKSFELAVRAQQGKRSVTVDVTAVRQVDAAGVSLLLDLIRRFKAGGGQLTLVGSASLLDAIRPLVPAGRRDDGEDIWMLALELLRVQGLRTEFDDLSIDYCVTFEVSPPPWEPMPDTVRESASGDPQSAVTEPDDDAASTSSTAPFAPFATMRGHPLAGQIAGRAQKELEALRAYAETRSKVVIDCRDLVRLDFVAAGELLNEVVSMRSAGKEIVFVDVSAIVAALLSVMGIPDLAEIRKHRI